MQVRYVWLLLVLLCLSFATAQSSRNQEREPRSSQTLITLSAPLSQTQFNELLERAQVLLRGAEFANKLTLETLVSFQEGPFEGNPFRTDKAVEPMLLRSASTTGVSNTVALCSGVMGVISTSVDRPLTAKELAQLSAALEEILGPDVAYGVDGQNDHDGGGLSQTTPATDVPYLEAIGALKTREQGFVGKGSLIAVIDTGVTDVNSELGGRLLSADGYGFAGPDTSADDISPKQHGTSITYLAAGDSSGVAPGAEVLPVRVCDKDGSCWLSNVIQGVCYALIKAEQRDGAKQLIMNLSLGGDTPSAVLADILKDANALGASVAAAAGNNGPTFTPHYPAAYSSSVAPDGLVTTGSLVTVDKNWLPSNTSTSGTYVDIAAPGYSVLNDDFGTSYATGLVTGSLAVLRGQSTTSTPATLESCLWQGATPPFTPSDVVGEGLLNVANAVSVCQ